MALICPNVNDPKWIQLVDKVGEIAAYRTFYRNSHLADPLQATLDKFEISNYTIEQKKNDLLSTSDKIRKIDNFDPETGEQIHEYRATNGKVLESVSRILDTNPQTAYRGGEGSGSQYSDKGTAIHKVFEMYINDVGDNNISQYMEDQKIPLSFLNQVRTIVNSLRVRGKVLSETMLADLDIGIAGTGDIPLLTYDGSIELYDIKTAHLTPIAAAKGVIKIWDPVNHFDGYKARRYPAQLEMYSRMIERTTGQPVSKKFIIPIEVKYKDHLTQNGFEDIKVLPFEDIDSYGNKEFADKIVSDFFGDNRATINLPSLASIDDSDDLIRNITGRIEGRETNLDEEAELILSKKGYHTRIGGVFYYINPLIGGPVKLKDQSNRSVQKRQVIDEYLSKINGGRENIIESAKNYLVTGKDTYLDSGVRAAEQIKDILDIYKGRKDVGIVKLSDISGFEKKKNWILITDGDPDTGGTYDLLYIGNDVLDETINVGRKTRKGDTLFAKFHDKSKATKLLGSDLRNRLGDARKFEAGLIAIKLKEASINSTFNRILITSTNSVAQKPEWGDLNKLLPVIQNFGKFNERLIPTNAKSLFANDSLFDPKKYLQNSLDAYKTYIGIHMNSRERRGLSLDYINSYDKEKNGWDDLKAKALADATSIEAAGLNTDPVLVEEMRLLRNIYYNLESIGNEIYPIGLKGQFISMGQNIGSDIIQDLVAKTSDALRRVTNNFWDNYKKPTEKYFNALFSPVYKLSGVRDALISDTERYYEPLLEKKEVSIITGNDEAGNSTVTKRGVITYNLADEHSDTFKELSETHQNFIKMFNDRVDEAMSKMGIKWQRGKIPLVHSSYRNQLYKAYQLGTNATLDHYKNSLRKMFDEVENTFVDTIKGDDAYSSKNNNIFFKQANGPDFDGRDNMIGIGKTGFLDVDQHGQWETNLEIVLDMVMMTAYRSEEMDKLNNIFLAAKNHFAWQKSNLFEDRLGANIDMVNTYRNRIIHGRDMDAGTVQSKTVRTFNKATSAILLGFKPGVALMSTVGQQIVAASQSVSNSLANNGRFTASNWSKSFFTVMNPVNWKKVTALLEQYKLYDLDITSLLNGRRRYGDRSVFKMKWMFGFLNAGDWLSRSQILVAQLIQDGAWDAHSINEQGELHYDEDKDERFKKENGDLLKDTIKANLEKEGLNKDGRMTRAYDFNLTRSIKGQIDMVIGGFDKETRGMYDSWATGKLFGLFKTYMPSRIDKLTAAPFNSRMIGKYDLIEEDGKKQYVWKGDQLEGIFHSLNTGMFYLQNLNSEHNVELTTQQKTNVYNFAGDVLMLGLFALLGHAIDDDDDETKMDDFTAYAMQGAVRDLLAFYNVFAYLDFISTPVAIGFLQKTTKKIYNIIMKAPDPNSETLTSTMNLLPAAKEYQEIADYLYNQPSQ